MTSPDLDHFRSLSGADHGLAVVAVTRDDGTVSASVVNAGVLPHPRDGAPVVAFVSAGGARRLDRLRRGHAVAVTMRAGWTWATVEGTAEIAGPHDPHPAVEARALPTLLRDIFTAAGGSHDDWDGYDRAMATEGRAAVLIRPVRAYTNPNR